MLAGYEGARPLARLLLDRAGDVDRLQASLADLHGSRRITRHGDERTLPGEIRRRLNAVHDEMANRTL